MTAIKREEIIAKNAFTEPTEEAKVLNSTLDLTEKALNTIAEISAKKLVNLTVGDSKSLKEFNDLLKENKKDVQNIDKFDKIRLATLEKIKFANSGQADDLAELNLLLNDQKKINKEAAKRKLIELGVLKDEKKIKADLAKQRREEAEQKKALIKTEKERIKAAKELKKQLKAEQDAIEELSSFEKKHLALKQKLIEAESQEALALAEINVQIQEQKKANKNTAKDRQGLIDAYSKESAELNDLRKKYKNLAVQNKENTKEGKALLKNITRLDKKLKSIDDTVGQNQRSVGKYEKALSGLNNTIGKLGIIAAITKGFELLGDVFGNNREGALALQLALKEISVRAQVFINNLIEAGTGIKEFFIAIHESFLILDTKIEKSAKKMQLAFLKILDKNPFADYTKEIAAVNKEIGALDDTLKELSKSSVSDSIDKITEAFKDTGETIDKSLAGQKAYLELQLRIKIAIEQQEKALAGLAEKRQILQDISDDDTIGFVARAKAVKKAKEAAIKFAILESRLAKEKEKLTIEAVKQDLRQANAQTEKQLAAITTGEQLKNLLKDDDLARKVSDTNDEAFTAAFIERREKQVESESFRRDQEEKFRKTFRDAFEQENDILTEFTELKIAANEKIINSDKATLQERQKALAANVKLEKELFENSINLILEQGKASIDILKETIDLRTDLTAKEKEEEKALLDKRKALLTNEAIQEIINEQDIVKQGILIRNIDLGEIEEKVLKDTLKLKKELIGGSKEAAIAEQEAVLKTKELQEDILLQEQILSGEKIDLDDERFENEKNNLETRIDLLKEDSIERLELQRELNDLLIEEDEKKNDELDRIRQEEKDAIQALANDVIDIVLDELAKKDAARLENMNSQISRQEELINTLRQNAVEGTEKALAFEEARLEKQRLAKQREEERQAKRNEGTALAQTFLNQVAEQSKDNPDTAIAEAFKNTFLAKAIAKGLLGFYEGTDEVGSTGTETKFSSGRDGYVVKVDKGEKIFNSKQSDRLNKAGFGDRADVVDLVEDYAMGNTWDFMPRLQTFQTSNDIDLSKVVESNERVVRAIESIPPAPIQNWESFYVVIEERFKKHGKDIIKHVMKHHRP